MFNLKEFKKSLFMALWFMFLTFPIMVIKVNTIDNTVIWRWMNLVYVGAGAFFLSWLWRFMMKRREETAAETLQKNRFAEGINRKMKNKKILYSTLALLLLLMIIFPFATSLYQVNIMTTALMYVVLGLGLNIVVGFGGLLHLGYAAFYAVGAYTYGVLFHNFGLGFWTALPLGALLSALFGILLGFPILRLRGDYLAIVTLAFGEIIRLVLENWSEFSRGPGGIANISRPGFFGQKLKLAQATNYTYFITAAIVVLSVIVIKRIENSKMGRAWEAMREDEIACQAMGIDITRAKLAAFSVGAVWAGIMGVMFAAKNTFINPASFTTWESILILCVVVIGGMGSIPGVIIGALIFILTPEYLRAFSQYRMLIFGIALVLMMIFRPGGIIPKVRRSHPFKREQGNLPEAEA